MTAVAAAQDAVQAALSWLGTPYVYGGNTPGKALDCSGLVQQAFARAGIKLPRVTYDQVKVGAPVNSIADAIPGDLIFSVGDGGRTNGHVAIYLGGGKVVAAPHTGTNVQVQPVAKSITAIRRVTGGTPVGGVVQDNPGFLNAVGANVSNVADAASGITIPGLGDVGSLLGGIFGDLQHAILIGVFLAGGVGLVVLGARRGVSSSSSAPGLP